MKREDKIADALAERLVDSFGGKAIEVIEILVSLERNVQKKERLAFADWITKFIKNIKDIRADDVSEANKLSLILDLAEAKIKELRSEGKSGKTI